MASPLPSSGSPSTTTVSSTTWAYFTAGGYNWIIIGRSNKTDTITTGNLNISGFWAKGYYDQPNYYNFTSTAGIWPWMKSPDKTTSAGKAIYNDYINIGKDVVYNLNANSITQKSVFTNAAATDELEVNEVLCLCATNVGDYRSASEDSFSDYRTSLLKPALTTVYNNIKSAAGNAIQLTSLNTCCWDEDDYALKNCTFSDYLFPLAASADGFSQNFCVETYLNTTTKRVITNADWWLRTSNARTWYYCVNSSGEVQGGYSSRPSVTYRCIYLRPAFVLQI